MLSCIGSCTWWTFGAGCQAHRSARDVMALQSVVCHITRFSFLFWKQISSAKLQLGRHPKMQKTLALRKIKTHFPGQHTRPGRNYTSIKNINLSWHDYISINYISINYISINYISINYIYIDIIYCKSSKVSCQDFFPPRKTKPELGHAGPPGSQAGSMFWPGSEPSPHVAKAGRAPVLFLPMRPWDFSG